MPLRDYLPFGRKREFATVGSNPPYNKDNPRSFGAGVIKRIKLQIIQDLGDMEVELTKNLRLGITERI